MAPLPGGRRRRCGRNPAAWPELGSAPRRQSPAASLESSLNTSARILMVRGSAAAVALLSALPTSRSYWALSPSLTVFQSAEQPRRWRCDLLEVAPKHGLEGRGSVGRHGVEHESEKRELTGPNNLLLTVWEETVLAWTAQHESGRYSPGRRSTHGNWQYSPGRRSTQTHGARLGGAARRHDSREGARATSSHGASLFLITLRKTALGTLHCKANRGRATGGSNLRASLRCRLPHDTFALSLDLVPPAFSPVILRSFGEIEARLNSSLCIYFCGWNSFAKERYGRRVWRTEGPKAERVGGGGGRDEECGA